MRASPAAGTTLLLWLLLSALACTSGTRTGQQPEAGAGGSSAGLAPSTTGGNAAMPALPSGSGGAPSASGSGAGDSAIANGPAGSAALPTDAGFDAAPPARIDASVTPPDAATVNQQPGCPAELPEVYATCSREGIMCEYGMECCPDFAYCEFGQWSVLTHHCDACI